MSDLEPHRQPPILLMGPTGAGKTALAMALRERLHCELVSVDSALVYRGMNIGTAKPTAAEQARAPHRLIDIIEPTEAYSAARFRADALQEIAAIRDIGRRPLLVGGTMLYFRALQQGLAPMPAANPALRERLQQEGESMGWRCLHGRLAKQDPRAAERIDPNDPQRILRALEVFELTGRPISELQQQARPTAQFPVIKLALMPNQRTLLHQRIARRFHAMLEAGFVEEVEDLRAGGRLAPDMPSMRCVGYRQIWQYLDGELTRDEMVERGIIATRQLAKRQLTWLRAEPALHALPLEEMETSASRILDKALKLMGDTSN